MGAGRGLRRRGPGRVTVILLWNLRFISNKISGFRARPMYSEPLNRDLQDEPNDSPAGPSFLGLSGGQFTAAHKPERHGPVRREAATVALGVSVRVRISTYSEFRHPVLLCQSR